MNALQPLKTKAVSLAAKTDEPAATRDRAIGSILQQARALSDAQVEQIVGYQRTRGVRFGEAAMALQLASMDDVLWALSQQFDYAYAGSVGRRPDPELTVAADPFGNPAEAFRELRSELLAGPFGSREPQRALAVLSTGIGDGKTYFAANMAIALSQLGARTVLVDADMRTPRQHALFGIGQQAGLSGLLAGRGGSDAIRPIADLPNLYVLPVGTVPPNPLDLIVRPSFDLLLERLLHDFDHVLLDTPAARHGSDGRVLAAKCGAAVVVGRRHVSAIKPMQALLRALAANRTVIAGVLINEHAGAPAPAPRWWGRRT